MSALDGTACERTHMQLARTSAHALLTDSPLATHVYTYTQARARARAQTERCTRWRRDGYAIHAENTSGLRKTTRPGTTRSNDLQIAGAALSARRRSSAI